VYKFGSRVSGGGMIDIIVIRGKMSKSKRKSVYWTDWEPGIKPGEGTNKDLFKVMCPPRWMEQAVEGGKHRLKELGLSK